MKTIGTASFRNLDAFVDWYRGISMEDVKAINSTIEGAINNNAKVDSDSRKLLRSRSEAFYKLDPSRYSHCSDEERLERHKENIEGNIERFRADMLFAETYDKALNVAFWEPEYAYVFLGNPSNGFPIYEPEKHLVFTPAPDYSEYTLPEIKAALGAPASAQMGLVPADQGNAITKADVTQTLGAKQQEMDKLKEDIEDVKNAKEGELAVLKAEIDKKMAALETKKSEMMAALELKKKEMEEQMELLNNQIYLLDSEIYSILCYAGEVVNFGQIRKGKNAPDDEPIVIHQKLRFLDEDLGLLASLYEIEWEDIHLFEEFLKHSPIALDTFAPNERCIALVRLSKTGTQMGSHVKFPYANLMTQYEYYHGKTVGIIIRNGENVYLGWTDEDRVHIQDDLIMSAPIDLGPVDVPEFRFESERESYIKTQKRNRKIIIDGIVSRVFVYSVLQGIVDRTPMLPLPEGVKLNRQSEYVLYSVADRWLADTRFGSFNEIIASCNQKISTGDMILTVQKLVAERAYSSYSGYQSHTWNNARGRGDRNRTHDVSALDCTIYPVNLIEHDDPIKQVRYKYPSPGSEGGWAYGIHTPSGGSKLCDSCEILEEFEVIEAHIFISLEKEYARWRCATSRANFEVHPAEFINLTYMNSVWLEWAITNKQLGGWKIKGEPVNYSYAIRYMKTAMDFIKKREEDEKALIDAVDPSVCENADWPLKLTEWKLAHGVRNITSFQAKRFAKAASQQR